MAIKKLYFHFSHQKPRGGSSAPLGSPYPHRMPVAFPLFGVQPLQAQVSPLSARASLPQEQPQPLLPHALASLSTLAPGLSRHRTASVPTRPDLTWTVSPRWAALPPGAARRDSRSSSSSPWRENWRPLRPPRPPARDAEERAHLAAARGQPRARPTPRPEAAMFPQPALRAGAVGSPAPWRYKAVRCARALAAQ